MRETREAAKAIEENVASDDAEGVPACSRRSNEERVTPPDLDPARMHPGGRASNRRCPTTSNRDNAPRSRCRISRGSQSILLIIGSRFFVENTM